MHPVRVRPAHPADAEAIARIYVDAWRDAYAGILPDRVLVALSPRRQAAFWRGLISRRGGERVLVSEDAGGRVVAFGSCGRAGAAGLPFEGEVYTLYVAPGHQGVGIGRPLLRRLFRLLRRQGMKSALVWVLADNPARFFYEAVGGRLVATREERLWGTTVRQLAYGWDDPGAAPARNGRGGPNGAAAP